MIVIGGISFALGGSTIALPGLIGSVLGVIGFIKNRKLNKVDEQIPWGLIIVVLLLTLGLISMLTLVSINPYEQANEAKEINNSLK
jgi:Na+/melibiose symporter-like transporter